MTTSIFHLPPAIYPACYATISFLPPPPWSEISRDGWVSRGYEYPLQLLLGSRPPHKWLIMCDDSYAGVHPSLTYMSLEVLKTKRWGRWGGGKGGDFVMELLGWRFEFLSAWSWMVCTSEREDDLIVTGRSLSASEGRISIFIIWLDFMYYAMCIQIYYWMLWISIEYIRLF